MCRSKCRTGKPRCKSPRKHQLPQKRQQKQRLPKPEQNELPKPAGCQKAHLICTPKLRSRALGLHKQRNHGVANQLLRRLSPGAPACPDPIFLTYHHHLLKRRQASNPPRNVPKRLSSVYFPRRPRNQQPRPTQLEPLKSLCRLLRKISRR